MPSPVITVPVDELQTGDEIQLLGKCSLIEVEKLEGARRIVLVKHGQRMTKVWLWKYSRIELLSPLAGRGHVVTPVKIEELSNEARTGTSALDDAASASSTRS